MQISIEILARSKSTGFVKIQLSCHRNSARQINSIGIYNDRLIPEIPVKITRSINCKKAREPRHNYLLGQGESGNFVECAPMLRGTENPEEEELKY